MLLARATAGFRPLRVQVCGARRRQRQHSLLAAAQLAKTLQRPYIEDDYHRYNIPPSDLARQTERHWLKMELYQREYTRRLVLDDKMSNPALKAPFNQGQSERARNGARRMLAPSMAWGDAMVRHLPDMGSNRRRPHTQFGKDVGQQMWARCG